MDGDYTSHADTSGMKKTHAIEGNPAGRKEPYGGGTSKSSGGEKALAGEASKGSGKHSGKNVSSPMSSSKD